MGCTKGAGSIPYVCVRMCTYVYVSVRICTNPYVYVRIRTYMYVYVRMCTYGCCLENHEMSWGAQKVLALSRTYLYVSVRITYECVRMCTYLYVYGTNMYVCLLPRKSRNVMGSTKGAGAIPYVSVRIRTYLYESVRICTNPYVSVRMCTYVYECVRLIKNIFGANLQKFSSQKSKF
jgi:hypothetical protein